MSESLPLRDREQQIQSVVKAVHPGSISRPAAERIVDALLPQPDLLSESEIQREIAGDQTWVSAPGRMYERHGDGHRSPNDIAQDIVDKAPEVESLVEEWFAATTDRLNAGHVAKECLRFVTEAARGVLEMLDGPGNALYAVPIDRLRDVLSERNDRC